MIFGIAPRPYVTAFTSQSNTHEIMYSQPSGDQYHERVAWVDPSGGDPHASTNPATVTFDADQLGRVIYGIYEKMFSHEKIATITQSMSPAGLKFLDEVHFQRESIAVLLRTIKNRAHLKIINGDWDKVVMRFLELVEHKGWMSEINYFQDLCTQLHLHGVFTVPFFQPDWNTMPIVYAMPRSSIFDGWTNVPPVVCVVFTIPRKNLGAFLDDPDNAGSPRLQCFLRGGTAHNTHSTIHAIWGKCVTPPGTDDVFIEEDEQGIKGKSDMVVSFWVGAQVAQFGDTKVALEVKLTPQTAARYWDKIGQKLIVFSASIMDKKYVRVLRYCPTLASEGRRALPIPLLGFSGPQAAPSSQLCQAIVGTPSGQLVDTLSVRFEVESVDEQEILLKGATVSATQVSPCTMQLMIDKYTHLISFPYPIQGNKNRLRIARKSQYIEVSQSSARNTSAHHSLTHS